VLDWTGGNKQRAARVLGLGRKTLYRKLGGMTPDDL
jgi:DNA-binding protein Fis